MAGANSTTPQQMKNWGMLFSAVEILVRSDSKCGKGADISRSCSQILSTLAFPSPGFVARISGLDESISQQSNK
jgi:hypothetical protein